MSSVRTQYQRGLRIHRPSGAALAAVLGGFLVFLGASLLGLGIYHAFAHGSCSTTGYSANFGPVQHCAKGIGWWSGMLTVGILICFAGAFLASDAGGAAIAVPLVFVAVGAASIALGLRGGHAQLALGMSSSGGKTFALIFGACFAIAGLAWGAFAISGVAGDPDFSAGASLRALVGGALGVVAAFAIAAAVNSGIGTATAAQVDPTSIRPTDPHSMFNTASLRTAMTDIDQRLGAGTQANEVVIYPGYVNVIAQRGSGQVWAVRYVGGRYAQSASGTAGASQGTFPLSQVDVTEPAALARQLVTNNHVPESQLRYMVLMIAPISNKLEWLIYTQSGNPFTYTAGGSAQSTGAASAGSGRPGKTGSHGTITGSQSGSGAAPSTAARLCREIIKSSVPPAEQKAAMAACPKE